MAGVEAPLMMACQARERGERRGRRSGAGGHGWEGGGLQEGGLQGGLGLYSFLRAVRGCFVRERMQQRGRRKEKGEEKGK
jgi:hypothetical protein